MSTVEMADLQPGDGVYLGSQYHEYVGPRIVAGQEIPELCMVSRLGGKPKSVFRSELRPCTEADNNRSSAYSYLRRSGRLDPK